MLCLKSSNRLHLTQATGLVTVPQRPSHCYGVRSPQALGWSPGDESETWESWSLWS